MEQNEFENEIEIDVVELLFQLWKGKWRILLSGLTAALFLFAVCEFLLTPTYTASTKIYILNRQSETVSYSDFQASNQLTRDYEELITGLNVTERVIAELSLDMTNEELSKKISVNSPDNTLILIISVEDSDPYLAKKIANSVREIATEQIIEIMDIDAVNVVYEAKVPDEPDSPKTFRNTVIGMLAGMLLASFVIVMSKLLNNTFQTPDDIETHLSISVLGSVPVDNQTNNKEKKSRKRKSGVKPAKQ